MKSLVLFFLLSLTCCRLSFAQCATNDFALPAQACRNQNVHVEPINEPDSIEWDFCSGDFENTPVASPAFQVPNAIGRPSIDLVKAGNTWFGFVTGTWTNSLQVLEFANGLNEAPTHVTSFGNLDGKLKNPGSIRIIREQGVWYGIVHNTESAEILKLTFDNGFERVSNVAVLTSDVGYINSGLALGRDAMAGWIGIISEPNNTFTIIRFGFDLHPTLPEDIKQSTAVPNPNNLGDVDLINVCGKWFAAAVNLAGGSTYLLSFDSNLFSIPQIDEIADLSVVNAARVRFANEGSDFFLFVASLDGVWQVLKFGGSIGTSPIVENENDLNGTLAPETYGLALAKENSEWTIFALCQNNGQVYRVTYEQPCSAVPETSREMSPIFKIQSAGTALISMKTILNSEISLKSRSMTVLAQAAPDIAFVSENVCAGHDVIFTSSNLSADINTYEWDFGDLTISASPNPVHSYAAPGSYTVNLGVTSANGCTNQTFRAMSIFPEPVAGFNGNSDLLCTYNDELFTTTTPDIYHGNLSYQWLVDNAPVGTDRDLEYTFTSTGRKDIKLITAIPGCSDEVVKTTSDVQVGPVVDFSYTGACEDETFSFESLVTDPVEGYLWNFGIGAASSGTNADYVFDDYGDFPVTLTATNAIGCENKKTKTIAVHARPISQFTVDGPPNACSGIQTQFVDASTSIDGADITEWVWAFDDPASPAGDNTQDAKHIFAQSGSYNVSLTSSTEYGCQATTTKFVEIERSPSTDYSHTPSCDDLPVRFSPPTDNTITSWYWEIGNSYYTEASPSHTFKSPTDYPVYLRVTTANGCISSTRDIVHVPVPLSPAFSALKNCVGEEAIFEDVTEGADPVVSRQWNFESGETLTGSPLLFTFQKAETKNVTLKVTAESGCSYTVTKEVDVLPAPIAGFAAEPAAGGYPLEVRFENTSSEATGYLWTFNDGNTSSETSPVHVFAAAGSYDVLLTAFNEQQCDGVFMSKVTVVAPLPDVDIEIITLAPNDDGSTRLIVTLNNKGNTVLKDLPLELDLGGLHLRTVVTEPVAPRSKYNYVFNMAIDSFSSIDYICVFADLANDLTPEGNRRCEELENKLLVFPVFPNPAHGLMDVEWIASDAGSLKISVTDALGRLILEVNTAAMKGLNRHTISVDALQDGIYYLVVRQGSTASVQRIAVSHYR